jgi:hypothetical protein
MVGRPPREVLVDLDAPVGEVLAALGAVGALRHDLDGTERGLIERAREEGVAWPRIAEALGLASRQAAEQRFLRLGAARGRDPAGARASRRRQQGVDHAYGTAIRELRMSVRLARRQVGADAGWDGRHPRAALVRASLDEAADASPSAMFALVEAALDDLGAMSRDAVPPALRPGLDALRAAAAVAAQVDTGRRNP